MTPELKARFREVYPTGKSREPDETALNPGFQEEAVSALEPLLFGVRPIQFEVFPRQNVATYIAITDADGATIQSWRAASPY